MPSEAVQPLRIQKHASSSPSKSDTLVVHRPLSELSPMERRRNSPSYNQPTKKMVINGDSSPFDSSPFSNSPRLFWQGRDIGSPTRVMGEKTARTRDGSPSPVRRSSIENLKRASRVKNSNMFAREQKQDQDPVASPRLDRPLANGRALATQPNGFGGRGIEGVAHDSTTAIDLSRTDSGSKIPIYSPSKTKTQENATPSHAPSPSKSQASPTKSSLSNRHRFFGNAASFDPESGTWSEEDTSGEERRLPPGRSLHRHAKSVTFDAAPPQVNEYEMTTPDLSSVASGSREGSYDSGEGEEDESFERSFSMDRDESFDASLEDTTKTPVVEPEDWRHMSPETARDGMSSLMEDPFHDPMDGEDGSPMPTAEPIVFHGIRPTTPRTDSMNSNGERRPLPPLPPLPGSTSPSSQERSASPSANPATAERTGGGQRDLPSLPTPTSALKSEIRSIGANSMSLDERMRLMAIQDQDNNQTHDELPRAPSEELSEERPESPHGLGIQVEDHAEEQDTTSNMMDYQLPPRISRESILRKVEGIKRQDSPEHYDFSSPPRYDGSEYDPDVPLPSLEDSTLADQSEMSIAVKQEEDGEESEVDLYAIPDMYNVQERAESRLEDYEEDDSIIHHDLHREIEDVDDDDRSHYSEHSPELEQEQPQSSSATEDEGPETPRPQSPPRIADEVDRSNSKRMSLPEFASLLGDDSFDLGLRSYMSPSPPPTSQCMPMEPEKPLPETSAISDASALDGRLVTPEEQLLPPNFPDQEPFSESERGTPDSVIRHLTSAESPPADSPSVPEPVATIKAPGGRLKTRPSATPADMAALAAARRQVSGEHPVPPIPEKHRDRTSLANQSEGDENSEAQDEIEDESNAAKIERKASQRSLMQLEMPVSGLAEDLSFGLDEEFDRLIEAQKRGYLMRQNTKIIVASSNADEQVPAVIDLQQEENCRGTKSAGNSPRKISHDRGHSWTTEPWNGHARRKSVRQTSGSPQKRPVSGPAPPLPGKESNVTGALGSVAEAEVPAEDLKAEEGEERGRLFVKVVGVKDLDLPLPKTERTWFCLTLDNGLHCVTTAWLELGKTAPIGQEFELVVLDDLEFTLTLQTKLEKPAVHAVVESSPVKAAKPQKTSTFSRVFASPKKRKELEKKQQEDEQRVAQQKQHDAQAKRRSVQPTAWDLLHDLVARDGSFARSYVCLKNHESKAFGRPYNVDIPCFNEWAAEDASITNSSKGKRTGTGIQRRPPYKVGKLELQLLYVPKPKGAKDDDMPKSMNACIRQIKEAEASAKRTWEGHLSQQGGDCPYWRRRFFRLSGSKLTAYHETTRQPRATINLAKASRLIDDRSSLMQNEASGRSKSRRKSAFAEEEEGYMFVEEGFRVRFGNGETIDFYADSREEKDGWMKVLADTVGKDTGGAGKWTDVVLAREKAERAKAAAAATAAHAVNAHGHARMTHSRTPSGTNSSSKPVPNTPNRHSQMLPPSSMGRHAPPHGQTPVPPPNASARRANVRSMIF
ncbi:MAG: hypothetical protein M1819_006634 [Sarea resinae]|nr:MAG: hypothetical protein M1819_006634 [Sarea resinae]